MTKLLVVVDDDPAIRQLIQAILQQDGNMEICGEAETAEQAIESARQTQPDIAILDHYIHGKILGIDAAPLLKAVAPKMKILLFTSHDLLVEAGCEPAIDGFLSKQDVTKLLSKVKEMLADR